MDPIHASYFSEKISKIPSLTGAIIFKHTDGVWRNLSDNSIADSILAKFFESLSSSSPFIKIKSPSRAIFLLQSTGIVVSIPIGLKSRSDTLARHFARLEECLTAATSSYHAHHDELTGVLNRHGIRHSLSQSILDLIPNEKSGDLVEAQLTMHNDVILFSFDIDRFKSVNDSLGHSGGDLVLFAFASRIASLVPELERKYSGRFIFGRPGGEEFDLIGIGEFSDAERQALGEYLLENIRTPLISALPPNKHKILEKAGGQAKNLLSQSGGVTASIGLSWRRVTNEQTIESLYSALGKESDAALYRAKADGRNCLRAYPDIRKKHGKVVEFHEDSGLIQIDIGSKVGVKPGDSFSVFFPPYTGGEKIRESAQSLKLLGVYPAIESARVRVIAVQNEASTCEIIPGSANDRIPVGSRLSYLYLGSRHTPVKRTSDQLPLVSSLCNLVLHIEKLSEKNEFGALCLLSPAKPEIGANLGERLSQLIPVCYMHFPVGSEVFYSLGSNIYVVVPNQKGETAKDFEIRLRKIAKSISEIEPEFSLNFFPFDKLSDFPHKSADAIILCCNALLLEELNEKSENVRFFHRYSPIHALYGWKKRGEIWQALSDYQNFRSIGVDTPLLHNLLALAVLELDATDFFPMATSALRKAVAALPNEPILSANLGTILARQNHFHEAYQIFKPIEEFIREKHLGYSLAYAKSALELYRDGKKVEKDELRRLLKSVSEMKKPLPQQHYFTGLRHEIQQTLTSDEWKG